MDNRMGNSTLKALRAELAQYIAANRPWSVMAIDNEPDNLALIQIVLEGLGAEVILAYGGEEGMSKISQQPPSFVLLDLSMPVMDGWSVLSAIRANPAISQMPVVAVTAHALEQDRQRIVAAGFNGYVSKPYHLETLFREMLFVLSGAKRTG